MIVVKTILSCVLLTTVFLKPATSQTEVSECKTSTCTQDKGYIDFQRNRATTYRWTLRSKHNRFTTFVIILKDLQAQLPHSIGTLLTVEEHFYTFSKTHSVNNDKGRLFVFKNTKAVDITIFRFDVLRFRLEFYVGCDVLEEKDMKVDRQPSNNFNPAFNYASGVRTRPVPTCWIVIPSIQEEIKRPGPESYIEYLISIGYLRRIYRRFEVQQLQMIIQNVSLPNDTRIQVTDIFSGNSIISINESAIFDAVTLDKSNTTLWYKPDFSVSTLVLLDISCKRKEDCEQAHFNFHANALKQKDVDCIEREQKCLFNLGEKNFNCTPPPRLPINVFIDIVDPNQLFNSSCPASSLFIESILLAGDQEPEEGSGVSEENGVTSRRFNARVIYARKKNKCKDYRGYCTRRCGDFSGTYCAKFCLIFKHRGFCRNHSIWA